MGAVARETNKDAVTAKLQIPSRHPTGAAQQNGDKYYCVYPVCGHKLELRTTRM